MVPIKERKHMAKADYAVIQVDSDRVFLVDLDLGGRSVTNDAEAVCEEMQATYLGRRVIYRDTMGKWDEMRVDKHNKIRFVPYDEYIPDCEITMMESL
jgi:hypothetical protein